MFSQTKTISIQSYLKHRLARQINFTDEYLLSSPTSRANAFESPSRLSFYRELTTLTKTQIKVIVTVVFIISCIMLVIAFFRFKNACRTEEAEHLQTDIIRNRAAQYSEPSSRRGSVGYYTQRYHRSTNLRLDEQFNPSLPNKRLSIPACDPLSKETAVSVCSASPADRTDVKHQHHHVTTLCDTSKISDLEPIPYTSILYQTKPTEPHHNPLKLSSPTLRKLCLPCITARNHPRPEKRLSKTTSQQFPATNDAWKSSSRAAIPSNSQDTTAHRSAHSEGNKANQSSPKWHSCVEEKDQELFGERSSDLPLTSSELREAPFASNECPGSDEDEQQCDDRIPLLTTVLTSTPKDSFNDHNTRQYSLNALLRPSSSHPFCSSLTSTIAQGKHTGNNSHADLKTPRRASLSSSLRRSTFAQQPPAFCSTVDSSTTKTTSPPQPPQTVDYESSTCSSEKGTRAYSKDFMHKIERFRFIDDSASSTTTTVTSPVESIERESNPHHLIHNAIEQFEDDMSCLIDCLNSDLLINSSYSDFQILQRPQTLKPVNGKCLPTTGRYSTNPIPIPHSITSLPLSKQRYQGETNGHSRSMDFHSNRREQFESTPSSSTMTLTSQRSLTSLEFDDNSKPSGVLVDDDFLPMSSPVDEHFWTMSTTNSFQLNHQECFPNVGSSPDLEVKHFDAQQMLNLSETSADEEEEEEEIFTVQELKIKSLSSDPSIDSTEQFSLIHNSTTFSPDQSLIENLPKNSSEQDVRWAEDDAQDSSANDASEGDDESADNGEIDLEQEFQLSQSNHSWPINNQDIYLLEKTDFSLLPLANSRPTSIMKITHSKSTEPPPEESQQKPKVRFNLDPQYEREREWNKVNKLLGNSVEWTEEFEV